MGIRVTWYGHAALHIETGGTKLLVDPFFTGNPAASTTADRVDADFILVTHGHGDHVGDTVAIARRTGATVIGAVELVKWLSAKGVAKVHGQNLGGGHLHPFGYVKMTFATHTSGLPDGSYGGQPAGFLLTLDGRRIYLAGDTGLFGDMSLIGDEGLDLACLPIGDNYTMGPDDSIRALGLLRPKHVIPIHYNTWDLIAVDVDAWAERVAKETSAEAHVLKPGWSFVL
jgi:L-ascorbate metabolism protein UlaG (beta-lactamase superfamily)